MSLKSYMQRLERREKRRAEMSGETWHRKAYHRFFEGYTEYRVRENGKLKLKRIYTADYYSSQLKDQQRLLHKAAYGGLFIASSLLFLAGGLLPALGNMYWLVNILQLVSFIVFILLGSSVFYNLSANEKMEIRIYKSASESLKSKAKLLSLSLSLTAALTLAYGLAFDFSDCLDELAAAAFSVLSAGAVYMIFHLENKVKYIRVKNTNTIENGAIDPCEIKGEKR